MVQGRCQGVAREASEKWQNTVTAVVSRPRTCSYDELSSARKCATKLTISQELPVRLKNGKKLYTRERLIHIY